MEYISLANEITHTLFSRCENLHALHASINIIRVTKSRKMSWARQVALMSKTRGAYRVLVGKPERSRPLERPRHRWEGINMNPPEAGRGNKLDRSGSE
jgi:hypothetical protein